MKIVPFVQWEYATVNAFDCVKQAKREIIANGGVVVLMNEQPIGLLTSKDLITNSYNLVIDCLTEKPKVNVTNLISEVLKIMQEAESDILPVYDENILVGIISKGDITERLLESGKEQENSIAEKKLALAKIAYIQSHEFRKPVASILGIMELIRLEDYHASKEYLLLMERAVMELDKKINEIVKHAQ